MALIALVLITVVCRGHGRLAYEQGHSAGQSFGSAVNPERALFELAQAHLRKPSGFELGASSPRTKLATLLLASSPLVGRPQPPQAVNIVNGNGAARSHAPAAVCVAPAVVEHEYLFGPYDEDCGKLYLERHPELALPQMCVIAKRPPLSDHAIETFMEFLEKVFDECDEPFSVLWDARGGAFPTMSHARRVMAWMAENDGAYGKAWDSRIQGSAVIIQNPLMRNLARVMLKLVNPPQPVCICKSEDKAMAFAQETFTEARDWS
jgi:hypothetical protein